MTTIDQVVQVAQHGQGTGGDRPLRPALLRGLMERCPACGKGRLLHRYLKVRGNCSECGEDFSHARADDGPAYLTVSVVSHLLGILIPALWMAWRMDPVILILILVPVTVGLSLFLLPRFKGMIVGWQWAKRMHGF